MIVNRADAERIYEWTRVEKQAPLSAHRWVNRWVERVRKLETFPEGRARAPENGSVPGVEVFQQFFGTFRTLYVVREAAVFVIHVHALRLPTF